jgi:hypothetical protein
MILLLIRVRGEGRKEKDLRIRGKRTEREDRGRVRNETRVDHVRALEAWDVSGDAC